MKITLEMISRDLAIKYPEIVECPAFKALDKLGKLRSTKDIGFEKDGLLKDYNEAMRPSMGVVCKEPTSKATAQVTEKPAAEAETATEAESAQQRSELERVCVDGIVEQHAQNMPSTMPTVKIGEVLPMIDTIGQDGERKPVKIEPLAVPKSELPKFLKDMLKEIK